MNEKEQEAILYRFSGYQLPKIQLDSTGDTYYDVRPHPYFYNQPLYWQKPCYGGSNARTATLPEIPTNPSDNVTGLPSDTERWSALPLLPLIE